MAQFSYTARGQDGKIISETAEAANREALGQTLRGQGLLPTSIVEKKSLSFSFASFAKMWNHVSLLEKLTFTKNLAVTMRAGLPVSRALNVVTKQMTNAYFRSIIGDIAHNVESGKTVSESLEAYPKVFSPIFVNMMRVGETSGNLDSTLDYLGKQMARDYNLLRKTKGALTYPAVVIGALLIIGYIMFAFVLPKLTATFKDVGAELPLLTRVIIGSVDIVSQYAFVVAGLVVALVIAFLFWRKTASGQMVIHTLNITLPVARTIVKKINLARFTIIFGGLLKSGMPIVDALSVTAKTMTNMHYQKAIAEAADKVRVGVDLVAALERYPKLFTPMVTQMVQVGEESGTMETVLEEVAQFYEAEVDDTVKNLSSIIEPVLVIVIGAVVGVLAVGLILPIYNIGQTIS